MAALSSFDELVYHFLSRLVNRAVLIVASLGRRRLAEVSLNLSFNPLLKVFYGFLLSALPLEFLVVYFVSSNEKAMLEQFELSSGSAHLVYCNGVYYDMYSMEVCEISLLTSILVTLKW